MSRSKLQNLTAVDAAAKLGLDIDDLPDPIPVPRECGRCDPADTESTILVPWAAAERADQVGARGAALEIMGSRAVHVAKAVRAAQHLLAGSPGWGA